MKQSRTHGAGSLVALAVTACAGAARAPDAKSSGAESCHYAVKVTSGIAGLDVDVTCTGGVTGLRPRERTLAPYFAVRGPSGPLTLFGEGWKLPEASRGAHYHIDLDALAKGSDDFDVALRIGDSVIAPASTYLLEPDPLPAGAAITVEVTPARDGGFTTALERAGHAGRYRLEAQELHVASYSVFGRFSSSSFEMPGLGVGGHAKPAKVEIALLDGKLDVTREALDAWITATARAVAAFWGGFPIETALVSVVPIPNRSGIVFGKLLPASRPGIVVLLGERTDPAALFGEWVLVHEMFHLGSPSFVGEGKWLDEGLATYYEPIIRVRAGWATEEWLWGELVRDMPQGMRSLTHEGLEHASDYRSIYWGGAILCLLADARAREKSGGKLGLEDGLRSVLASGGNATEVWDLADDIASIDKRLGSGILADLASRYARSPGELDLEATFRDLGIERTDDGVRLRDDAPRAAVRRAIVHGGPPLEHVAKGATP